MTGQHYTNSEISLSAAGERARPLTGRAIPHPLSPGRSATFWPSATSPPGPRPSTRPQGTGSPISPPAKRLPKRDCTQRESSGISTSGGSPGAALGSATCARAGAVIITGTCNRTIRSSITRRTTVGRTVASPRASWRNPTRRRSGMTKPRRSPTKMGSRSMSSTGSRAGGRPASA
jgi:hypothetical protein